MPTPPIATNHTRTLPSSNRNPHLAPSQQRPSASNQHRSSTNTRHRSTSTNPQNRSAPPANNRGRSRPSLPPSSDLDDHEDDEDGNDGNDNPNQDDDANPAPFVPDLARIRRISAPIFRIADLFCDLGPLLRKGFREDTHEEGIDDPIPDHERLSALRPSMFMY